MISRSAGIFKLPTGANVAYQRWGNTNTNTLHSSTQDSKRILALHGWLDNSNSFSKLGSYLGTKGFDFVAIDLPGHGLSSHVDAGIHYFPFCVETVRLILDSLGWSSSKSNIVGHSMGAGISMIFNGCYPELVSKSVLIDQIAPLMTSPSSSASKLRKAIDARLAVYAKPSNIKEYPTFDDTISARLRSLSMWPGQQTLSVEAATAIMERGVVSIQNTNDQVDIGTMAHSSFVKAGPVVFRHDPKLTLPSYTYFSEDQTLAFADQVTSPLYFIEGETGLVPHFMNSSHTTLVNLWKAKGLLTHSKLPGSHHLHLDPDSSLLVAQEIESFLSV